MYDLALSTNSLIKDPLESETMWTVGGVIKSKDWSADDLTILRAYEWDRINFTDPKKLQKVANRMGISVNELNSIRKRTLNNAIKTISERRSQDDTVKKAADIALVSSENSIKEEQKKL
jgi:AraC-like DNA-binding protein